MKISILTLFPEMFSGPFNHSIIKRAQEKKLLDLAYINIRDFGIGKHQIVDDTPYGGGVGMVLRVDVIASALKKTLSDEEVQKKKVVLLDTRGEVYNQRKAKEYAALDHLVLIAGHYEGIDERIAEYFVDETISIGDYILTGGEIPSMVIIDSVARLLPGAITKTATDTESFSPAIGDNTLEYPHYTKPQLFNTYGVPEVLLSGDHAAIATWRKQQSLEFTKKKRPDLLKRI